MRGATCIARGATPFWDECVVTSSENLRGNPKGLGFFILPLTDPGVTLQSLRNLTSEFPKWGET